jgi:hypothetical protein
VFSTRAICSEESDGDGEAGSGSLSDSESAFDDVAWTSLPRSLPETGVVFLRPTTFCGDDGGDRKATCGFSCAWGLLIYLNSNSESDSYPPLALGARCNGVVERLGGDLCS